MHSLEMLQRMNSAKGSAQIRRNAIILNKPGAHPKDAEKGRRKAWLKDVLADAVAAKKKFPGWAKD
jgi:hypothetical protein